MVLSIFALVVLVLSLLAGLSFFYNIALEGRYAIQRELGEGGMATVYLADDLKHERMTIVLTGALPVK